MYSFSHEGKKLRNYWKPHGKTNAENQDKIRKAMADSGVKEASIPAFLYHEKYQSKHAEVARSLKL